MKTSSKKRKTGAKTVANVAKQRAKPAAAKRRVKPPTVAKPVKTKPGTTRAGADAATPRFFWMFAFGADDPEFRPVWWDVASGGTPRIGPPHHNLEPEAEHSPPNNPGPVAVRIEGLSPKISDDDGALLFFIMSPCFPSQEEAEAFARSSRGAFFRDRCANCVLYKID